MARPPMLRRLAGALAALSLGAACAQEAPAPLAPTPTQAQAAYLGSMFLSRYHYAVRPLDDALSERIFERYLKTLDPERTLFSQADIDGFAAYRHGLDDAILQGQLAPAFEIYQHHTRRTAEFVEYARGLLPGGFDFTVAEHYPLEHGKGPWPADEAALRDLWRKRVKNDWLRLRLGGKDDAAIRETLGRRYDGLLARSRRLTADDVFQAFMNAYASAIEPHTNYLGRSSAETFDISMRLSLVGIGAVLQERDEFITIRELTPGGPAARSGKLAVGDRIVGVAQGPAAPVTDLVGVRVDEAVKLIRGTQDTPVVLDILPADAGPDASPKRVELLRDRIKLEEQAARKSVIELPGAGHPRRIGVITLPAFYEDFEGRRRGDKDYRSASRDVARLIAELRTTPIDGLILDLRDNGGGSLREAVTLTGLFIDTGPVVQQRAADGKISVERDEAAGTAWDGPLSVMINRNSASASEILAAALQDHGRALIVGEQSFGKGTVQTMIDLDELARSATPQLGELKMTVAQFFRIDGGSTQLKGVTPDIRFPSAFDAPEFGEAGLDNALPWSRINAAPYKPVARLGALLPELRRRHAGRMAHNPDYQALDEEVKAFLQLRAQNALSLEEGERRREKAAQDARRQRQAGATADPERDGLQSGEGSLAAELAAEKQRKGRKDFLLDETARITADLLDLGAPRPRLAARGR